MNLESLLLEKETSVKQLFNNKNKELYKENINSTIEYVLDFLNNDKFYSGISVSELKEKFETLEGKSMKNSKFIFYLLNKI